MNLDGQPRNEDELRAAGWTRRSDGVWVKKDRAILERLNKAILDTAIAPVPPAKKPKKKKELNKTEHEFLCRLTAGVYGKLDWLGAHESIRLELADACTYAPDFPVIIEGQFAFYEVKGGHVWEDAWIKLKMAARTYSHWPFYKAQKEDGQWTLTPIPK